MNDPRNRFQSPDEIIDNAISEIEYNEDQSMAENTELYDEDPDVVFNDDFEDSSDSDNYDFSDSSEDE